MSDDNLDLLTRLLSILVEILTASSSKVLMSGISLGAALYISCEYYFYFYELNYPEIAGYYFCLAGLFVSISIVWITSPFRKSKLSAGYAYRLALAKEAKQQGLSDVQFQILLMSVYQQAIEKEHPNFDQPKRKLKILSNDKDTPLT